MTFAPNNALIYHITHLSNLPSIVGAGVSPEAALRGVHGWNRHKAETMQRDHVFAAWHQLRDHGWL